MTNIVNLNSKKTTHNIWGVPHGLRNGPLLFTLYSSTLQDIIRGHGVDVMFYADDTQLCLTCIFDPADRDHAIRVMEALLM